jgi:hypothetical protein
LILIKKYSKICSLKENAVSEFRYKATVSDVGALEPRSTEIANSDIYATVEVIPPIDNIGPAFRKVALGRNPHEIDFEEIVTNDIGTFFLAKDSARELPLNERVQRFSTLASRIGQTACWTDASSLYMFDEVFTKDT